MTIIRPTTKIYNSVDSPHVQIGHHRAETIFNQLGVPIQRKFYYHGTAIVEQDLVTGKFVCNDGGWNTTYTARYITEYYKLLIADGYMLSGLNIVGDSYVPRVLAGYQTLKERGITNMVTQANTLEIVHFGKNYYKLKKYNSDVFTVHFNDESTNRQLRNYVAINGSTLNDIFINTNDGTGGFEIELVDTQPLSEMPIGLWFYKETYYRVDFEVRQLDVNLQRHTHHYVLYATSIYKLENKSESGLLSMCGADIFTKDMIIEGFKSFAQI